MSHASCCMRGLPVTISRGNPLRRVRFRAELAFYSVEKVCLADEMAGCWGRNSQLPHRGRLRGYFSNVLLNRSLLSFQLDAPPTAVRNLYTYFGLA